MTVTVERFRQLIRTIHDLQQTQGLLDWDQQTMMPKKSMEQRSHQLAALATVIHEKLTAPELGEMIDELTESEPSLQPDLRELARERDRALRTPEELVAEQARVHSTAQAAWEQAFERNDFSLFRPDLERVVDVARRTAAARTRDGVTSYEVMLEEYEPGTTETELAELFDTLGPALRGLVDRIQGAEHQPDPDLLRGDYPTATQERFLRSIIERMGFDFDAGRVDRSTHPFTAGTMYDVRITNRYRNDTLAPGLFGMIHEAGHALYEQGLDPQRYRDPAGAHCSLGIHESQSRLWENLVARSRSFWYYHLPLLKQAFPGALDTATVDEFYGAINAVHPSLIRVEADEVTYNLHIILRFRLERALLRGDLDVGDIPGAWAEQTEELLGKRPESDRDGPLQDVHWSAGLFGYFPTYALGNLYSAQLMATMRRDLPTLDEDVATGNLLPIKRWLNEKIHRHGRRCLAQELCRQATGEALSPKPALDYLEKKYTEIYHL